MQNCLKEKRIGRASGKRFERRLATIEIRLPDLKSISFCLVFQYAIETKCNFFSSIIIISHMFQHNTTPFWIHLSPTLPRISHKQVLINV